MERRLPWACPPEPWRESAATLAAVLPEIVAPAPGKDVELPVTWPVVTPAPMDSTLQPIIRNLNSGQLNSDPFNLRAEEMAMQECSCCLKASENHLGDSYSDITGVGEKMV